MSTFRQNDNLPTLDPLIYLPQIGDVIQVHKLQARGPPIYKSASYLLQNENVNEIDVNDVVLFRIGDKYSFQEQYYIIKEIGDRTIKIENPDDSFRLVHSSTDDKWYTTYSGSPIWSLWKEQNDAMVTFLGPQELTEEDIRKTIIELVTPIESSDTPLNYYIPTVRDIPGAETVDPLLIIKAKSLPGAVIAYMDWIEHSGEPYLGDREFLVWDDLSTHKTYFIGKDPKDWPDILVDIHEAHLERVETDI